MKIKHIILYVALAVAFASASIWVLLSGNKNAKAVKAKFRLGGLLLTVSTLLASSSCTRIFQPTCYDTPAPEHELVPSSDQKEAPNEVPASNEAQV